MQVFKAYFKIILKNIPLMSIYIIVFLGLAAIFAFSPSPVGNTDFEDTSLPIAVINQDGESPLSQGLTDYLGKHFVLVSLENTEKAKQDALFYQKAIYIATIPQGFSRAFNAGEKPTIETVTVPNTPEAFFVNQKVEQYLNTLWLYQNFLPDATVESLISATQKDLEQSTDVVMVQFSKNTTNNNHIRYFNFTAYALLAILILGISSIMMVFNQKDLRLRNLVSPMTHMNYNLQLIAGSFLFSFVVWIVLVAVGIFFFWSMAAIRSAIILCSINVFVMMLAALSIGFLVSQFVKARNVQSAMANVISLGLCFLSGVFVPQLFLGDAVLKVAQFNPVFWFVKANETIGNLSVINQATLMPIFINMGIVLAFAVAIFVVAMVVSRVRRDKW